MTKKIIIFIACFVSVLAYAQEIGIVTENDLYVSTVRDQYYTNGLEFYYRYLINKTPESVAKKTIDFRLGQYMYNPQTTKAIRISLHDRPFAGYLFAEGGISNFYKDESVLKLSGQIGVLGPMAQAEELQKWLHRFMNLDSISGWEYQIKNTMGLQASLFYSQKILSETFHQNIDFQFTSKVNVGTIWTGAQIGIMTRVSIKELLPIFNSNLFGASLNKDTSIYKQQREFYLYFTPNLNCQLYDATIQGSLFNNESPIVFDLKPFRFIGEIGLKYRYNHWNLSYSFVYKTQEPKNNAATGHYYGSVSASYLIGE